MYPGQSVTQDHGGWHGTLKAISTQIKVCGAKCFSVNHWAKYWGKQNKSLLPHTLSFILEGEGKLMKQYGRSQSYRFSTNYFYKAMKDIWEDIFEDLQNLFKNNNVINNSDLLITPEVMYWKWDGAPG